MHKQKNVTDSTGVYRARALRHIQRGATVGLPATIAIVALMALGQPLAAYAAPGDLDTTFSSDGKQTTDFFGTTDVANAVAVQTDGKIVAAGYATSADGDLDFAIARYHPGGVLDDNFDGDGKQTIDFFGLDDSVKAIAIQPDGKILVAGYAENSVTLWNFAVARLNPDGSPDTSFSGNGRQTLDFDLGYDVATSVALQSDEKIVLGGSVDLFENEDFGLMRFMPNGTLDTSFSGDGMQRTDFGSDEGINGIAIQPSNNRVVAVGWSGAGSATDFAAARYLVGGNLDTSFSFDGKVTTDFQGDMDYANDVALQTDGKIVAAGLATLSGGENFGLVRYLADGTLDTSFSGNGRVNTDFGNDDSANALLIQANNKIVAVGYSGTGDFALARYNPSGALDTTFSTDGMVVTPFPGRAEAGALQADGKILAAGNSNGDFALARYDGDPLPTPTPTLTPTRTRTPTATRTPTRTNTPLPTQTPGGPTATPIPTNTTVPTNTRTNTPLPTQTPGGPTATPIPTDTFTPTSVPGATGTATPTSCPLQFEDVPPNNTFYTNVRCLACQGIINGYPCGGASEPCNPNNDPYFRPGNLVTRGQIAKIAANSAGFNEPVTGQTFEDVLPGSTFYEFIERLVSRDVMSGYTCGGAGEPCVPPTNRPYFRPNATATRAQLSKIVSNAAGFNDPVSGQTFEDVAAGSTFYEFIERLASRGAMSGYACGAAGEPCVPPGNRPYFRPNNNVTRGQTSKIVGNAFFPGCDPPVRAGLKDD